MISICINIYLLPRPELIPCAVPAYACDIPIAVPITNVIPRPIPNVTSFGCAVMMFMILVFSETSSIDKIYVYKVRSRIISCKQIYVLVPHQPVLCYLMIGYLQQLLASASKAANPKACA
jgi:hypothetical protein